MKKPDPEMVDDDSPELDDEWFRRARPAAELLPEVLGPDLAAQLLRRKPGQRGPQKAPVKKLVSLRLDPDVVEHFKAQGDGWQSRMNEALRKAAGLP